jgi:hypothetical protein
MEHYSVLIMALRVLGLRLFSQHDVDTKKTSIKQQQCGISLQMSKVYKVRILDFTYLFRK